MSVFAKPVYVSCLRFREMEDSPVPNLWVQSPTITPNVDNRSRKWLFMRDEGHPLGYSDVGRCQFLSLDAFDAGLILSLPNGVGTSRRTNALAPSPERWTLRQIFLTKIPVNTEYHLVRVILHNVEGENSRVEEFSDAMRAAGAIDVIEGDNGVYFTLLPGEWHFPVEENVKATLERVKLIADPYCVYSSAIAYEFGNTYFSLNPIDHPDMKIHK